MMQVHGWRQSGFCKSTSQFFEAFKDLRVSRSSYNCLRFGVPTSWGGFVFRMALRGILSELTHQSICSRYEEFQMVCPVGEDVSARGMENGACPPF